MSFALIVNGSIEAVGRLPASARRLDTRDWVMGLADAPADLREATGWLMVTEVDRPADTATTTFDADVELVDGRPYQAWKERPRTAAELADETERANRTTIEERLALDLAVIDEITATNALSLTQADLRILQRQVKDLARIDKRLIRLSLRALESTD